MRENFFRGKRLYNGVWILGDLRHWRDGSIGIHCDVTKRTIPVDPETVGQYTGLKDKTGKRIFEGDIVRVSITIDTGLCDYTRTEIGEIAYDNIGMIALLVDRTGNGEPVWSDVFCELSLSGAATDFSFEIIGNIHDNPELLEFDG